MNETRDLLERVGDRFAFPADAFDRLERRRDSTKRNRRLAAGVVGLALAIAVAIAGAAVLRSSERPAPADRDHTISPLPIPSAMQNGPISLVGLTGGVKEIHTSGTPAGLLISCRDICTETESAAWTQDGTKLVYVGECGGGCGSAGDPDHGIRVFDVSTGRDTLILQGDDFADVDWSPDGTQIAFSTPRSESTIKLMNADGSHIRHLPRAFHTTSISWSPDGTRIAYSTTEGAMFVETVDGSSRVQVGQGFDPDWSPDGTMLAYVTHGTGCQVRVVRADGSAPTSIVALSPHRSRRCDRGLGYGEFQPGPIWSPDGRSIAVLFDGAIALVDVDDGGLQTLPVREQGVYGIAWRPVS